MREELSPALMRWLEARLAAIPAGKQLRITFRRDRAGHLSREAEVESVETWDGIDCRGNVSTQ